MFKDTLKVTGKLRLKVFENGVLIQDYEGPNLVVKGGKQSILNILDSGGPGFFIQNIAFGTNGTAPADSDNTITGAYQKPILGNVVLVPDITFNFDLLSGEANGMTIQEFGLMTNTAVLFARKTGISINKTASVTIAGAWTISLQP